ncbi:MAG TPA: low-specificity L-threonine aldolase [Promineifilum sp.]
MDRIDFRSDTVSWPTSAMREAMAAAPVGDDVYGEDPTVNQLEEMAASMVGKEAGLFVASGTMGNLCAVLAHAGRGEEAILGDDCHVHSWEAGNIAALGGVIPHPLPTDDLGRMDPPAVERAIRYDDPHLPRSRLILVENTYGAKHGYPLPPAYFAEIEAVARRHDLVLHMDGARLFNAAVAQNIDASAITEHVDSVAFCLSKGLCAPVGSVLCGSSEFIHRARRARKSLGGGMRQAGILAAAGIVALSEMVERLADDHFHARILAEGLSRIPGLCPEPHLVRTNMVFFELAAEVSLPTEEIISRLRQSANVWVSDDGPRRFRAVTHYWIGRNEVQVFLDALDEIMRRA